MIEPEGVDVDATRGGRYTSGTRCRSRDEEGLNKVKGIQTKDFQVWGRRRGCGLACWPPAESTQQGSSWPAGSSSSSGGCSGDPPNQINNPNSGGTPKTGGTLTVLGSSDVDDNLDPNYGYYTLDYLAYACMSGTCTPIPASRARPSPWRRTWPPACRRSSVTMA